MEIARLKELLTACHKAKRITELMPELPKGMTARHVYILDAIWQLGQSGEAVRVSDISDYLQVTRPSITKLVQELETLGAVEKGSDRRDKRVVLLRLTALGQRYYKFYVERYQSWLAGKLESIPPEDVQAAITTINRVYEIMRSNQMEGQIE